MHARPVGMRGRQAAPLHPAGRLSKTLNMSTSRKLIFSTVVNGQMVAFRISFRISSWKIHQWFIHWITMVNYGKPGDILRKIQDVLPSLPYHHIGTISSRQRRWHLWSTSSPLRSVRIETSRPSPAMGRPP